MSLSDCPKCWDTPCSCGYEYRHYRRDYLVDLLINAVNWRSKEEAHSIIDEVKSKIDTYPHWISTKELGK